MPMNSMSKYIAKPKAANVDNIADTIPINPSQGFDLTESPIIHVITLKVYWYYKVNYEQVIFKDKLTKIKPLKRMWKESTV